MTKNGKKQGGIILKKYNKIIGLLLAVALMLPGMATKVSAAENDVTRLAGTDRIETSIMLSKDAYANGSATEVVLAGWEGKADALTGTYLAKVKNAPLLFTKDGSVTPNLLAELKRLGAKTVYVLGGTAVIKDSVVTALEAESMTVKRVKGTNRYATAGVVAKEANAAANHVFLAYGEGDLTDALAAGPASAKMSMPVLLTKTAAVSPETLAAMTDLGVKKVTILGGETVVSQAIEDKLVADLGAANVNRVKGTDRFETATKIAATYFAGATKAIVANAEGMPDALVAGYFGALKSAPILVTRTASLNTTTAAYLKANVKEAYIVGGTAAVNATVETAVKTAITPVVTDLEVVSVSAITTNYVVVNITAPAEDMLAQEVVVKDSTGKGIEVKPLDIAAGDETAEFEFVTAVKADDLKGVWTVNDQSYDLDLFNKIEKMLEATTQIELNNALVALNLKNYDSANIVEYFTAQQKLVGTVEATELELADVQKLVDDANAKVEAKKDEKTLIKAIKDAHEADNKVAYLNALNNAALDMVNPDWVTVAVNGYFANIDGTEADLEAIQAEIDTANETILNAAGILTDTGIDKEKLTKSKELIEKYAPLTDKGVIKDSMIKTSAENITEQLLVVEAVTATTPTALKAKVTALATLVDNTATLDVKNYKDANGKRYVTVIKDLNSISPELDSDDFGLAADVKVDDAAKINKVIVAVNAEQASGLVGAVKTAAAAVVADNTTATQNDLIKALNNLGLKQVATENKVQYGADAADFVTASTAPMTKEDVQVQVDTSNLAAVAAATESTIIAKLNVFGLDNVIAANAKAYDTAKAAIAGVTPDASGDNAETVKLVKAQVAAVNKTVTVDAQVTVINEAETVAEVKTALDALANVDEAAGYLIIRSADREFVAAYVLEERPALPTGYANLAAIQAEIGTAITDAGTALKAHGDALAAINAITYTTTPNGVVDALDLMLDEDFAALSNVEKSAKAQEFQGKLVFETEGANAGKLKTPFITLAAAKALLK